MSQVATIDTLRTLASGSIGAAYAVVGTPASKPIRIVCFTNNTDADMLFSDDGVNNKLFIAHGSFKLFDVTTNRDTVGPILAFAEGTQYWVKQASAPSTGSVYIEMIYGN